MVKRVKKQHNKRSTCLFCNEGTNHIETHFCDVKRKLVLTRKPPCLSDIMPIKEVVEILKQKKHVYINRTEVYPEFKCVNCVKSSSNINQTRPWESALEITKGNSNPTMTTFETNTWPENGPELAMLSLEKQKEIIKKIVTSRGERKSESPAYIVPESPPTLNDGECLVLHLDKALSKKQLNDWKRIKAEWRQLKDREEYYFCDCGVRIKAFKNRAKHLRTCMDPAIKHTFCDECGIRVNFNAKGELFSHDCRIRIRKRRVRKSNKALKCKRRTTCEGCKKQMNLYYYNDTHTFTCKKLEGILKEKKKTVKKEVLERWVKQRVEGILAGKTVVKTEIISTEPLVKTEKLLFPKIVMRRVFFSMKEKAHKMTVHMETMDKLKEKSEQKRLEYEKIERDQRMAFLIKTMPTFVEGFQGMLGRSLKAKLFAGLQAKYLQGISNNLFKATLLFFVDFYKNTSQGFFDNCKQVLQFFWKDITYEESKKDLGELISKKLDPWESKKRDAFLQEIQFKPCPSEQIIPKITESLSLLERLVQGKMTNADVIDDYFVKVYSKYFMIFTFPIMRIFKLTEKAPAPLPPVREFDMAKYRPPRPSKEEIEEHNANDMEIDEIASHFIDVKPDIDPISTTANTSEQGSDLKPKISFAERISQLPEYDYNFPPRPRVKEEPIKKPKKEKPRIHLLPVVKVLEIMRKKFDSEAQFELDQSTALDFLDKVEKFDQSKGCAEIENPIKKCMNYAQFQDRANRIALNKARFRRKVRMLKKNAPVIFVTEKVNKNDSI